MLYQSSFEQKLLMLAIIFLPINAFRFNLPLVGVVISKLFILCGIGIYIYKVLTKKIVLDDFEKLCWYYLLVYFLWQCLCTIIGIYEYEYCNMLCLEQMDKLRFLMEDFRVFGWNINDIAAIKIWTGLRFIFNVCLPSTLFTYGITVWIYHIYNVVQRNSEKVSLIFTHIVLSIGLLCILLISYSSFEIGYLRGSQFCADFLVKVNPLLYNVAGNHGWWPPLLWKNQLRSLFPEPSFFGIVSTLIVPFLFYGVLKFEKKFFLIVYSIFTVMLFMTKARTALILFILQNILLLSYVFISNPYYIKKSLNVFFASIVSFFVALYLMSGFKVLSIDSNNTSFQGVSSIVSGYINDNVISVIGNKRSNSARLANVRATFLTGVQHPLWGVGRALSDLYIVNNFTEEDLATHEVKHWFDLLHQKGALQYFIPVLNQLISEMAQLGIPGLILYLLPIFLIFYKLLPMLKLGLSIEMGCISIAYIGSLLAMFSNSAFLSYYILTGLMFSLLHNGWKGETKNYEVS